jgi:hypothetical protein
MSSFVVALIAFAFVFGGAVVGLSLSTVLPPDHLSDESKDVIKLGIGLIGTLAALVLGLLIALAKGSYDRKNDELKGICVDIIALDRVMLHYGPEASAARELLRRFAASRLEFIWPKDKSVAATLDHSDAAAELEGLLDKLRELVPKSEPQRLRQTRALQLAANLAQTRWLLTEQGESSIPKHFLVVLIFWLMVILAGFGLFAPRNATVIAVLFVSALSVSGSIFLILEMDRPFSGVITVSNAPLRNALENLGK